MNETISIEDENGKVYEFEKHDLDVRLYDIFPHRIVGSVSTGQENRFVMVWGYDGTLHNTSDLSGDEYNLKPIKPKWYEDESKFPCIMVKREWNLHFVFTVVEFDYDIDKMEKIGWVKATEEILSSVSDILKR